MELRSVYAQEMIKLAAKDPRLVIVEADLMRAAGMMPFKEAYPDRVFDMGVAESNMVGVAAGLAIMGKRPFVHSFTPFVTRRCFDQLTVSCAYAGLNVKVVGSDPGITAEVNGGTHMSVDDVNLMRGVPGMLVCEPVDEVSMRQLLPQFYAYPGIAYMRLFRKEPKAVYDEGSRLILGKANLLRDGKDVAFIASGIMVANALEAAKALAAEGVSAMVVDVHTIKPLDKELVLQAAGTCKAIVTCENHSIYGGLGSAVAECLAENAVGIPLARIGFQDRYGEVGFRPYLEKAIGLSPEDLVRAAKEVRIQKEGVA
ncbi:MAG TPA: transketolase C-terminal domain-containing protein, partial [Clostridia bacterium]|nr:transketolase C-terminal domain-containing protein [Clostridia bacterium]